MDNGNPLEIPADGLHGIGRKGVLFRHFPEVLLPVGMIKEGTEENAGARLRIPAAEDQVVQAEGILVIHDGILRNRVHHFAGEDGIIIIFIQPVPELEIQGGRFQGGTVRTQQQELYPVRAQDDPENVLQVQQDHGEPSLFHEQINSVLK